MSIPSLPVPVIEELERRVQSFRNDCLQEALNVYTAGPPLIWRAGDKFPPRHIEEKKSSGVGPRKYYGEVASGYDAKRENTPKWTTEQNIIENMLDDLPGGTKILDAPVGTGRFVDIAKEKDFFVFGVDASEAMISEASAKIGDDGRFSLRVGDVRDLAIFDDAIDVSMMIRLSRWLTPDDFVAALKELQRVTKDRIIFTSRVRNHPEARGYDLINSALDGWVIFADEPGYVDDYRIIQLRPVAETSDG